MKDGRLWCTVARNSPYWAKASSLSRLHGHMQLRTLNSVGLLWTNDQQVHIPLPDNTQHLQETDIHAPGGIRTRKPSAAAYPRLRPHGHWDRLLRGTYKKRQRKKTY